MAGKPQARTAKATGTGISLDPAYDFRTHKREVAKIAKQNMDANGVTFETIIHPRRYAAGWHVAPFRNDDGKMILVRIGNDGSAEAMLIVDAFAGTMGIDAPMRLERRGAVAERGDREARFDFDDRQQVEASILTPFDEQWAGGIHVCPWGGRTDPKAYMVAVVDASGCARSLSEHDDISAASLAWPREFLACVFGLDASGSITTPPFDYAAAR